MNITLLSIPARAIQTSPAVMSYWVATESPNNFELKRADWPITATEQNAGSPSAGTTFTLDGMFSGNVGDRVSVHNAFNNSMNVGRITDITAGSPESIIETDIPFNATFDGDYVNDNTLFNGFYFEGRLTINDVIQPLTIIASPNSFGVANLDVSGVLRITTRLDKIGDYSSLIMAETNKSGKFTFEYRPCFFGYEGEWIAEPNTWFYGECVRSIEQGSNIAEFVPSDAGDAPFLNSFDRPVYFAGLPFDISFICPDIPSVDTIMRVTLKRYNANNDLLATTTTDIDPAQNYGGRICSLTIDPDSIESTAAYITAEIELI